MAKKIISFLFHFLLFSTPFIFTWVNEELFEFPKMLFVYTLTTLIASAWIIRMILEKRIIFKRSKFDFLFFFFIFSQLISTLISIHPQTSIFGYYSRLHGGLLSTISYLILYFAFVSNVSKKQIKYYFYTLTGSSFLVSLYSIPEHFGHSPSCFLMFGEFNASCWKQDVINRVFGSFGQPNWLAAYTVTLMPLVSSLFLSERIKHPIFNVKNLKPLFALTTSILLLITLLFTKSRSGFLAFAVSMSLYLLGLVYLKTKKLKYQISNIKYLSLYSLFFILILTIGTPYTPSFTQILNSKYRTNSLISSTQSPISDLGGTDSGEIRKIVWRGSIDIWKRYPIFGSGVETFAYSYYLDRPVEHNLVSEWDFLYNKAHNEFLNFLATTGVVGLLSYLLIILGFLVSSIQYLISKKNRQSSYLILGFISGYIALAISNFFGFSTVAVSLLFFLYPAFFIVLTKKELPASKLANSPDIKQIIFIVITLLTTSYLLMSVFTKWLADYQFAKAKNYISEGYLSEGIELLNTAITLSPNEAVFYNQLSVASGKMAINLAQNSEPQEKLVSQFTEQALLASNITLSLNPVHNNFYKTRSRLFITLSQLNPEFLLEAKSIVKQAILLAPTDAELYYYLSNIELALGETDRGINSLEKSIELKANYGSARLALAEQYELLEKFEKAKEQYQYILEKINPEDRVIREKLEQLEK